MRNPAAVEGIADGRLGAIAAQTALAEVAAGRGK